MFIKNFYGRSHALGKCNHHYIRKGYYLGLSPDVYVCMCCGEQRNPEQWEDFEARRTPPAGMLNGAERR